MSYHETALSSASPEWPTPQWIVDQLAAEFGPFDLDPAATEDNAKAPVFYTADDDGLSRPWKGRVWLNPPYGRTDAHGRSIGAWMGKAADEVRTGGATWSAAWCPPGSTPGGTATRLRPRPWCGCGRGGSSGAAASRPRSLTP